MPELGQHKFSQSYVFNFKTASFIRPMTSESGSEEEGVPNHFLKMGLPLAEDASVIPFSI